MPAYSGPSPSCASRFRAANRRRASVRRLRHAGVAGEIQQNPYSIGYVELIYALQNNLGYATVPAELTAKSEAFIKQINVNGQPIFPGR